MPFNKPVVLIPARMESIRFPGKPLAPILGLPMVIYCAQNAVSSGYATFICTDSQIIIEAAKNYGIETIKTPSFLTGTDRINWASKQIDAEYLINLQGDEPLINSEAIIEIGNNLINTKNNLNCIFNGLIDMDNESAYDPNIVKAVVRLDKTIAYLSRKAIRNNSQSVACYIKQLGLYAFHKTALDSFSKLEQSPLELSEKIEMLRWIDNSKDLIAVKLNTRSVSVDTPEDLLQVEKMLLDKV